MVGQPQRQRVRHAGVVVSGRVAVAGPSVDAEHPDRRSSSPGSVYFDTTLGAMFVWNGSTWTPLVGSATVLTSATAPPGAIPGMLWFDSVAAQMYVWFDDGSSRQWGRLSISWRRAVAAAARSRSLQPTPCFPR